MKRTILLLACSFMLAVSSTYATHINIGTPGMGGGGTQVSGTWQAGDTVFVYDHMIIAAGTTLTIQQGVTVLISDTTLAIELIALGNFYCMGTQANPVTISVRSDLIPASVPSTRPFPGFWGSIVCDTTCSEFLMLYTNVKYYGGPTLNNSPSVLLGLYKDAAGQTEPYINYRDHNGGKLVVEHCTFSNGKDDGIYIEGGNVIFAYNTTYQNGFTGGDATNLKAGTIADLCYNFYYSPNTNAFKLSNTGSRSPQCNAVVYNNTIVNAGWRRPTVKGGGIWFEAGVVAHAYNNLQINDRFGIKTDGAADTASRADYNYYYGFGQNVVKNFTSTKGLFAPGPHDILSASAGDKNPMLVYYPLNTDTMNSKYNPSWNFHPEATSPAVGKGTTNFTRHFGTTGITILGVTYTSPAPSTTIGAFGFVSPVSGIAVSKKTATIKVNDTINLTATVLPANADTATYTFNSTSAATATVNNSGVVKGIKVGIVKIYAKTSNGKFSDTCTVTVVPATGIQSVGKVDESFRIYPNPVQSELQLQFNSNSNESKILVYSSIGQLIINKNFENSVGQNNISISVENLKSGLYFISVQKDNNTMTKPFIKK